MWVECVWERQAAQQNEKYDQTCVQRGSLGATVSSSYIHTMMHCSRVFCSWPLVLAFIPDLCAPPLLFLPSASIRSSSSSSRSPRWKVVSSGRPLPSMTTAGSHDESHDLHEDYAQTAKTEAASFWSAASTTAAACLATAVILSSSLPAGAGVVGGDFGSGSSLPWRGGAPMNTMMLVADEGDYTSPDGRADVSQMVSELKKADRADSVLNSMVKINDVVDADEDGLLENPFAKEVGVFVCVLLSWVRARARYRSAV